MQDWNKMLQYALWPCLSLSLYFAVGSGNTSSQLPSKKQSSLSSLAFSDGKFGQPSSRGGGADNENSTEVSDAALIDSILTIAQTYYVDEARVGNRVLMESTLKSLNEQGLASLSITADKQWRLSIESDSMLYRFTTRYSYDNLLKDAIRTSAFLDRYKRRDKSRNIKVSGSFQFLSAMLASLDPHSDLLSSDEYRELRQGTEGSFGGLGVVVGIQNDVLTVIKPLPKSPAARAGVSKFDRIMQIDGKSTFGTTLDDLVQYMRGEPGSKVNLFVMKDGDFAPRRLSLTREIIQVDSVESKLISTDQGKIFYAAIDSFSARTASELRDSMIRAQHSADPLVGIILDMRSNPGGLLDQAVKVADLFIEEGRLLATKGRSQDFELAKKNLYHFDYPLVVLTNGDTASASEIVAGALRDHGRALIVGEPSFGKGSVQTVFELPGEKALKLTIARYFTPNGVSIQNTGITPDVWLQSVKKSDENMNLLGDYRYKSERYLDHSLDQGRPRSVGQSEELKAFYLSSEASGATNGQTRDVPLEFSEKFLSELALGNGVPFPKERLRASYWKASASDFFKDYLKRLDTSTQEWLSKKVSVDWSDKSPRNFIFEPKKIKFSIDLADRVFVAEGQSVSIPWRILNTGKEAISRLSLFATSNRANLGTNEILVGRIEAGQELKGVIRYDIKLEAEDGPVRFLIGLARAGSPVQSLDRNIEIEIKEAETPKFEVNVRLFDEKGGRLNGVLEAGEFAKIEIRVKNSGPILASDVDTRVANLSGQQIKIDGRKLTIGTLEPGETKSIQIPIRASQDLSSEQLHLGVSVFSRDLMDSNKLNFYISGNPSQRVSKTNLNVKTGRVPWIEN